MQVHSVRRTPSPYWGEIQVALTEKVEQLVLYAIQQHRRVEKIDREVETLKAELRRIQAVSAE